MTFKKVVQYILVSILISGTTLFATTSKSAKDVKVIEANSVTDDAISKEGEVDLFKFVLKNETKVEIFTTGSTDTYGYILDSNGNKIAEDDDNGDNTNFKITKTLEAGTYCIKIRGYDQSEIGDYSLHFNAQDLPNDEQGDTIDNANPFNLNSSVDAIINSDDDIDVFSLNIAKDGEINIYTTGSRDTYCYLLDNEGNVITEDDDNGAEANCKITTNVSKGTYYIKVRGYDKWELGNYTIYNSFKNSANEDDYPDTFDTATNIDTNSTIEGSINYPEDKDYFSFTINESKRVKICGFDSNISVKIFNSDFEEIDKNENMIYDSTQEPLNLNNCDGTNADSITALHQVLGAGTYYIVATGEKEQSYTLNLNAYPIMYVGNTIDDALAIEENNLYSAAIEAYDDIDIFSFSIDETKIVEVTSTGKQLFTLLNSNGEEITQYKDIKYKDGNPYISKTLNTGTYYIKFKAMDHLFTYKTAYKILQNGK